MTNSFGNHALTEYGYKASMLDFSEAKKIKIPDQVKDEIPTLNQTGFMKIDLDKYSESFVNRAKDVEYSIDIGCAYGFTTLKALEQGNKVIAFDASIDHLMVLGANSKIDRREDLFLVNSAFPEGFDYSNKKIGSILASRIMHFLKGEEVDFAFKKIHKSLAEGGKFYFTSVTPYHSAIKEGFLEKYKMQKEAGKEWAGEIENQWEINPNHKKYVNPFLHVFDIPDLESLLPKYGFKINDISLFDYPNDTDSKNMGHVGFEATKI